MGYASAMAWLLFVVIVVVTIIQVRVTSGGSSTTRETAMTMTAWRPDRSSPGGATAAADAPRRRRDAGRDGQAAVRVPAVSGLRLLCSLCRHRGLRVSVHLAGQRLVQAALRGLRQQGAPRDAAPVENYIRCGGGARCGRGCSTASCRRPCGGRRYGHGVERAGRLRLRLLPISGPQPAVRGRARHDDAARRGHDDPELPDLGRPGLAARSCRCGPATSSRRRVLHVPAAAVLPRAARARCSKRPASTARSTSGCSGASRCR